MSEGVPSVTSAEIGLASGFLGAGIGYVLAPKKYNLEQLLTIEPDVFEKSDISKRVSKGTEEQKKAFRIITGARDQYERAIEANIAESKLIELTRAPKNNNAYKVIKGLIPRARLQTAALAGILAGIGAVFVKIMTDPNS